MCTFVYCGGVVEYIQTKFKWFFPFNLSKIFHFDFLSILALRTNRHRNMMNKFSVIFYRFVIGVRLFCFSMFWFGAWFFVTMLWFCIIFFFPFCELNFRNFVGYKRAFGFRIYYIHIQGSCLSWKPNANQKIFVFACMPTHTKCVVCYRTDLVLERTTWMKFDVWREWGFKGVLESHALQPQNGIQHPNIRIISTNFAVSIATSHHFQARTHKIPNYESRKRNKSTELVVVASCWNILIHYYIVLFRFVFIFSAYFSYYWNHAQK